MIRKQSLDDRAVEFQRGSPVIAATAAAVGLALARVDVGISLDAVKRGGDHPVAGVIVSWTSMRIP